MDTKNTALKGVVADGGTKIKRSTGDTMSLKELIGPDYPDGSPIQISIIVVAKEEEKAKQKKKLVRSEWSKWSESRIKKHDWYLLSSTLANPIVANTYLTDGKYYWVTAKKANVEDTLEAAQRAAEENLADNRMYGFQWEVEEEDG